MFGQTSLLNCHDPIVLDEMLNVGGKDLVLLKTPGIAYTILHNKVPVKIKLKALELGGKELVMKTLLGSYDILQH